MHNADDCAEKHRDLPRRCSKPHDDPCSSGVPQGTIDAIGLVLSSSVHLPRPCSTCEYFARTSVVARRRRSPTMSPPALDRRRRHVQHEHVIHFRFRFRDRHFRHGDCSDVGRRQSGHRHAPRIPGFIVGLQSAGLRTRQRFRLDPMSLQNTNRRSYLASRLVPSASFFGDYKCPKSFLHIFTSAADFATAYSNSTQLGNSSTTRNSRSSLIVGRGCSPVRTYDVDYYSENYCFTLSAGAPTFAPSALPVCRTSAVSAHARRKMSTDRTTLRRRRPTYACAGESCEIFASRAGPSRHTGCRTTPSTSR